MVTAATAAETEVVVATEDQVIEQTRHWLERMVIGLNLCPFASRPYEAGQVGFMVCDETEPDAIYRAFLIELDGFLQANPDQVATDLFILSKGLADFNDYLDMLGLLEDALAEAGLEGTIQLASFHPDYLFEGVGDDDPANFTNRSPYPMFHLIREEGLQAALASYPNPEQIPERNMARLRELGVAGIEAWMAEDK